MTLVSEVKEHGARLTDQEIVQMYKGAQKGAWLAFGRGCVTDCPESIAADVVIDYLESITSIYNPFGFGKIAGYRKAITKLRKEITTRKNLNSRAQTYNNDRDPNQNPIELIEEREEILAMLLSLRSNDAMYLLLTYYCDMNCKQIAELSAPNARTSTTAEAQRKRLSTARSKLRELFKGLAN